MSERDNMDLTPEELRIQEDLRGLGEVRADAAFQAKLREQFTSGDIDTSSGTAPAAEVVPMPKRSTRWAWVAVPALAAVLAFVLLSGGGDPTWKMQDVRGTGTVTAEPFVIQADDREQVADFVEPGARLALSEGVELDIILDGVVVFGAVGPADFTLPEDDAEGPYVVTVHEGEFRTVTGPKFEGRELLLLTTEGRVEITGTSVAVFKNPDVTCVCVLEGTAKIGKDQDHLDTVPAGMRKVMFADGRDPMIVPIEPGHGASLKVFDDDNADVFK